MHRSSRVGIYTFSRAILINTFMRNNKARIRTGISSRRIEDDLFFEIPLENIRKTRHIARLCFSPAVIYEL